MKFAEKCPKCGGFVQTKSIRKSIGFGYVDIPVAQFCLNPVCDWYQDFAQVRKPEDIKEGYHLKAPSIRGKVPRISMPVLSRNHMIALGGVVAIILIYFFISFFAPVSNVGNEKIWQVAPSELSNNINNGTTTATSVAKLQETPKVIASLPTPDRIDVNFKPRSIPVKIDAGHGFFPDTIMINITDIIVWNNEGNVRPRVVLVSRDGLFENQLIQNLGRYQYQFNNSGKYTFALAENGTYKEYPNTTGSVIVR